MLCTQVDTFSTNLLDGDTEILKQNNNNVMKDYIGLQKTLLSHYKKWLTQVTNSQNKDMIGKINKDINYLQQWLDISEDIYSNQSQAQQKLVVLCYSTMHHKTLSIIIKLLLVILYQIFEIQLISQH